MLSAFDADIGLRRRPLFAFVAGFDAVDDGRIVDFRSFIIDFSLKSAGRRR